MITALSAKVVAPVPPFATVTVSDNVEPAAGIVIAADPLKLTPLIARVVARIVAVPAFPEVSAALSGMSPEASPYEPLTDKFPVTSTPVAVTLNLSVLFTNVLTSLDVPKVIYS